MKTTVNIIAGKMAANEAEANRIDIRELQTRRLEIAELRDRLVADPSKISDEEIARVVALQNEDGGFALVDDYRMDSDCRIRYVYEPSYACCQILIAAVMRGDGSEEAERALSRGLSFCCSRRLAGHGFDAQSQRLHNLKRFAEAGAADLLRKTPGICQEFAAMLGELLDNIEENVRRGTTTGGWSEDYVLEMLDTLDAYGRHGLTPVFVYGTLMTGIGANSLIEGCGFLGKAVLEGYSLYDLGSFPGIKPTDESARVMGEAILCSAADIRRLHVYEAEGELYDFSQVTVTTSSGKTSAHAYVFRGQPEPSSLIPLNLQPYDQFASIKRTHVWYVSYGSNMLCERFMCYVKGGVCRFNGVGYRGCSDATPPLDTAIISVPFDVYFGNASGSWGGGVAFLDLSKPGSSPARAYLVTREQYEQIHAMEGSGSEWYPDEITLQPISGIPAVTFSNKRRRPSNPPSRAYVDIMLAGLREAGVTKGEAEAVIGRARLR